MTTESPPAGTPATAVPITPAAPPPAPAAATHPTPPAAAAATTPSAPAPAVPAPVPAPRGPDWWLVLKAFFRQGRKIAAFTPSSKYMCRKLLEGIDWDTARYLVELGGGTGPVTAEAVKRMKPHTKLLVLELDETLCNRLKARFAGVPNVEVIQGDATLFGQYLAERGVTQVDHVLSELPLPSFPEAARNTILETTAKMLAPHGALRQLTVMPLIYYRMYCRYFTDVRFRFVPWNLPPGGVYFCRGYRGATPAK